MRSIYRKIQRYMPAASFWLFVSAAVAGILHGAFVLSPAFADFFNQYIASFFRALFAHLTGWIPFSLAEALILSLPVLFAVVLIRAVRSAAKGWRRAAYSVVSLLSVIALIYSMFAATFAAGYHAPRLDEKMDITRRKVSALELAETTAILATGMHENLEEITFRYQGSSVMPYSYDEMSRLLVEAYDRVCEAYPFVQQLNSRVKPICLSEPMTYTHISGVYTMFTGEANINVNYPDYVLPYTAAHELAHQRGIAREDEANFVAFLVCMASDDPYIRYSGYMNMYEYVSSALYSASKEYYSMIQTALDSRVVYEMRAYSTFFDKYRDNVIADVSETVNNSYLVIQGTEGTKSYGMVVDLAVAYLLDTDN